MFLNILFTVEFVVGCVALLSIACYLLYKTAHRGRLLARKKIERTPATLATHQKTARYTVFTLLCLLVYLEGNLILTGVRATDNGVIPVWYLLMHVFGLAVPAFIGLSLAAFVFTGEKVSWHNRLVYTSITLFCLAVLTGVPMFLWDAWQILTRH